MNSLREPSDRLLECSAPVSSREYLGGTGGEGAGSTSTIVGGRVGGHGEETGEGGGMGQISEGGKGAVEEMEVEKGAERDGGCEKY